MDLEQYSIIQKWHLKFLSRTDLVDFSATLTSLYPGNCGQEYNLQLASHVPGTQRAQSCGQMTELEVAMKAEGWGAARRREPYF